MQISMIVFMLILTIISSILSVLVGKILYTLIKLVDMAGTEIESKIEAEKETKKSRTHKPIEKSNFDNAFGGRKAYEIYKNTNGLYEPVTPSKGIKLEKKEE